MPKRKLTEEELHQRNIELAENVCRLEDCRERKSTLNAEVNKEIKYYAEIVVRLAQEINAGEITEDPQGKLL